MASKKATKKKTIGKKTGAKTLLPDRLTPQEIPAGFKLLKTIRGNRGIIFSLAFTPDGRQVLSGSDDHTVKVWDLVSGRQVRTLSGHGNSVYSVTVSSDGRYALSGSGDKTVKIWDLASGGEVRTLSGHEGIVHSVVVTADGRCALSGSDDKTVKIWDIASGAEIRTLAGHSSFVYGLAVTPDGRYALSGSTDKTVKVWDLKSGREVRTLAGHSDLVIALAVTPDGRYALSGSWDKTVKVWDLASGREVRTLEGHSDLVSSAIFMPINRIMSSRSFDGTVRLWRCDTWETIAILSENTSRSWVPGPVFHPTKPILATLGEKDTIIRLWELDLEILLGEKQVSHSVHYANAKAVLIGDTGVGKTGLGLVLSGKKYETTDSTHGRNVFTFDSFEADLKNNRKETRETLLWDMAGQPGYRLIHQLHLNEVAVALVVFDSRSETDPFAGVKHWDRALRQAQKLQTKTLPLKKYLIAARADRGGVGVSEQRIKAIAEEMGFDGFIETSAKEGWKIEDLQKAIRGSIEWEALPRVTSNQLFQTIKQFLIAEKESGLLISTEEELYRSLCKAHPECKGEDLRSDFNTCIGLVENRDLIRRLSFGGYVLLQPELLDVYASAMVNTAKDEPDGLGFIREEAALACQFKMPETERIADKNQEKILLIATVEELLRHDLIIKETTDAGTDLIFPSQFTRERSDPPEPTGKSVIFTFEGPILSLYATLAVRLTHSQFFNKEEMWKNAGRYVAAVGGTCGMILRELEEGRGELTLYFDDQASDETRYQFEDFIAGHLRKRALTNTVTRRQVVACPNCGEVIPDSTVMRRRERKFTTLNCPVCDAKVSLVKREEVVTAPTDDAVTKMEEAAELQKELSASSLVLKGKIKAEDFDVFLCHNSDDKEAVKEIGEKLKTFGILPWLDEWELRPGFSWQDALERQIKRGKSVAVLVGKSGIGPWQDKEVKAFLRKSVKQECPVIPVILKGCDKEFEIPVLLEEMQWVDFRKDEPDPMKQLRWGITGERGRQGLF